MQGGGEVHSLINAPAVAEVHKRLICRPVWRNNLPLAVEPELWQEANQQLGAILQARGWPVCADAELSRKRVPNFLLHGVPIVMETA